MRIISKHIFLSSLLVGNLAYSASTPQFHTLPRFSLHNPEYISSQQPNLPSQEKTTAPILGRSLTFEQNFQNFSWGPFTSHEIRSLEKKLSQSLKTKVRIQSYSGQYYGVFTPLGKNESTAKQKIKHFQETHPALLHTPHDGWGALFFMDSDPTRNEKYALFIAQKYHLSKISIIALSTQQKFYFILQNSTLEDFHTIKKLQTQYPQTLIQTEIE